MRRAHREVGHRWSAGGGQASVGRAWAIGASIGVLGFGLSLVSPWPDVALVRDLVLYNGVYLMAAGAAAQRARVDRAARVAWACTAVALSFTVAANVYYSTVLAAMDEAPYPSLADAGYLLFFPLVYVCLVLLLRQRIAQWHPSLWLDGLIAALAVAAVATAAVLVRVLDLSGDRLAVALTNLAYPSGDLLLLSVLAGGAVLLEGRIDRQWTLLGAGLAFIAVADGAFAVLDSAGVYTEGTALDLLWLIGACLIAWAAVTDQAIPAVSTPSAADSVTNGSGWALLSVPAAGTLCALVLLAPLQAWSVPASARWLALATLGAVTARTMLTYREVWALTEARRQATTDELTGLANRRGFTDSAGRLLAERYGPGQEPRHPGDALLLLDLDEFKEVNDSLGHAAGDELLKAVATRLQECCRSPEDVLARLGGDEFALLLPGADGPTAQGVAKRIRTELGGHFVIDEVRVHIDASIGISLAPVHGEGLPLLLRRADIAMYRAKARGGGQATYDPALRDPDGEDRLQRIAALRLALESEQMVMHYQPKVDIASGRVRGVEALVRWMSPERGLVYPDDFLPLAESAGLMPALTAVALDLALAQVAAWNHDGLQLSVAVNLPSAAIVDAFLPERIATLLERHGVPAVQLHLEITEDALLDDRVRARTVLARLRSLGVRIAIDDYGSGYSCLAYLRELPVDELKLDRSFVLPMAHDARAAAIVRSTVELAHSLGMSIVAEGVEDHSAATELASYGCDAAQGYYYTHALPATELASWLGHINEPTTDPEPTPTHAATHAAGL